MARRTLRGVAFTAAQYAIAIASLVWLLTQIDLVEVWALVVRLDLKVVLVLLGVTVVGLAGRFDTWYVLIGRIQPASYREAASVDLVVNFVNQLLPSRLSGRVAAPFVLKRHTGMSLSDATAIAGLHTAMFAMWYGLTAALGLVVVFPRLSVPLVLVLGLSTGLYLLAGVLVLLGGANLTLFDRLLVGFQTLLGSVPLVGESLAARAEGIVGFTADSTARFRNLVVIPRVWLRYGAGWAIKHLVASGLRVWLLFGAFGASVEPAILLPLYLVAAYSVTLLPLTPGGIGITEATATVVFVALGVPGEVAASAIFLDRFLGVYLPALAGWYPALSPERPGLFDSA